MSTRNQVRANRSNSKLSTGPSEKSRDHTRFNGLTHGLRSATLILPNEDPQRFRQLHEDWIESVRPRDPAEHRLVFRIVRDLHMLERAERAIDEAITTAGEEADFRQDDDVGRLRRWLFWDSRGPHPMHGISGLATGGPSTSWSGNVDDPLEPSVVVRRLESTGKGCEALIEVWKMLRGRLENDRVWQSQDRLKAVRMLGKQPVDAAEDQRVRLIYAASFALKPLGKRDAYEDLKSDMGTLDYEIFLKRIQARWPRELDTNDTEKANAMLLDLIDRNVERLEAKLEVHTDRAGEYLLRRAARQGFDDSRRGELLRRYEMACDRRFYRSLAAFWKHRREMERAEGGEDHDSGENDAIGAEELALLEALSCGENKNVTTEANLVPDGLEVEANQGVLITGKAFKLVDAGVIQAVDGGEPGRKEAVSTPVVVERSVLEAVEGEIHSSEPPMRRNC